MSIEYIKQIREQEEKADKIRHDAHTEARLIVNAAVDKAQSLLSGAQTEADTLYKDTIAKANDEAETDYERTLHHAKWECDMLLAGAEKKMDKAVSIIVRKVIEQWPS